MLSETEIETVLRKPSSPQQLADQLVQSANDQGGNDNTTVIVVDISAKD
jgi:serine/threonine protein phosphatase PrpC